MPMNNSQLSNMWGGMAGRSMPMGGRGMMEVGSLLYLMESSIMLDTLGQTLASAVENPLLLGTELSLHLHPREMPLNEYCLSPPVKRFCLVYHNTGVREVTNPQ